MAKTSKPNPPFIVSFGGEAYFLDQDLVRARSWKDRTITQLDGDVVTEAEVVSVLESRSFDQTDRVVILDDAQKVKADKALKAYIEAKDSKDESVVFVVIVRAEKLPEIWGQAARKGRLIEHKVLKTWDNNNEVVRWISMEATKLDLSLDKEIPGMLFQLVGADLYSLAGELRKLQLLLGRGRATVADLRKVLAASPSAEPFQVAEAGVERNPKKAMNLLSLVYKTMGEEAHVPITYSLLKQVEKLLLARHILERGGSEDDIATAIGMHPWRCKTYFLPNVKKHTMTSLTSQLGGLRKLDQDVKGPARSKRTRVELAVLSLAGQEK
jgi:DNA polymerase III delta subunit